MNRPRPSNLHDIWPPINSRKISANLSPSAKTALTEPTNTEPPSRWKPTPRRASAPTSATSRTNGPRGPTSTPCCPRRPTPTRKCRWPAQTRAPSSCSCAGTWSRTSAKRPETSGCRSAGPPLPWPCRAPARNCCRTSTRRKPSSPPTPPTKSTPPRPC